LLVDDNTLMLKGLRSLLELNSIQVVGMAKDGRQVIDLAPKLEPDVILMDIRRRSATGWKPPALLKPKCLKPELSS
jgi:YesN/AraC family two-component response regulator